MSRKRKKKSAGGSNPSNDLYNHPSVVAARGRKDANTPGGAPKGSKPRLSLWWVGWSLLYYSLIVVALTTMLNVRAALWTVVFALIFGALTAFFIARRKREPWSVTSALMASVLFSTPVVVFMDVWSAFNGSG